MSITTTSLAARLLRKIFPNLSALMPKTPLVLLHQNSPSLLGSGPSKLPPTTRLPVGRVTSTLASRLGLPILKGALTGLGNSLVMSRSMARVLKAITGITLTLHLQRSYYNNLIYIHRFPCVVAVFLTAIIRVYLLNCIDLLERLRISRCGKTWLLRIRSVISSSGVATVSPLPLEVDCVWYVRALDTLLYIIKFENKYYRYLIVCSSKSRYKSTYRLAYTYSIPKVTTSKGISKLLKAFSKRQSSYNSKSAYAITAKIIPIKSPKKKLIYKCTQA
ncbi:Uncharacterized protein HZ326_16514 [Fusarium oxysporum f. sp. albedinis]|nr:Uncharacterized protein HZ326_16514 [Fusarium oxysporum f. sp. albedinis]